MGYREGGEPYPPEPTNLTDTHPPTCTNLPLVSKKEGPLLFTQASSSLVCQTLTQSTPFLTCIFPPPCPIASAHTHAQIKSFPFKKNSLLALNHIPHSFHSQASSESCLYSLSPLLHLPLTSPPSANCSLPSYLQPGLLLWAIEPLSPPGLRAL